jgi:hypothetical protein
MMNREKIAGELIKIAKNLVWQKPVKKKKTQRSSEYDSLEEFRGSKLSQVHASDRVFKSGFTGKVNIIESEKKFYVYLGGSEDSAKSKGARLLKNIDTHWSVPDLTGYDFYVGYDGGIVKVGRSRTSRKIAKDYDAYDAHFDAYDALNDLDKRLMAQKNINKYLSWSNVKTSHLGRNDERGDWATLYEIDPSDEAEDVGAKNFYIRVEYYDSHDGVNASFQWGEGRLGTATSISANPKDLKKMASKVVDKYLAEVHKKLIRQDKVNRQKALDDLEFRVLQELTGGGIIYDRDLSEYAEEFGVSTSDMKSALKQLVRDGDAFREGNGWTEA